MKKIIFLLLLVLVVSCTSIDLESVDKDGKPLWVTTQPVDGKYIYGVGSGLLSNAENSRSRAEVMSRNQIASNASADVRSALTNYVTDSGEGENRQILDAFESISVEISKINLKGVEVLATYIGEDGTYYVLSRYAKSNLKEAYSKQVKEYEDSVKITLEDNKAELEKAGIYKEVLDLVSKIDSDKMIEYYK